MGHKAVLDAFVKRKILAVPGIEPRPSHNGEGVSRNGMEWENLTEDFKLMPQQKGRGGEAEWYGACGLWGTCKKAKLSLCLINHAV
jgi:hypothetical protein